MNYLFEVAKANGHGYIFDDATLAGFQTPAEFDRLRATAAGVVLARCDALMAIAPRRP